MSIAEGSLTIEEYRDLPDDGRLTELVRGKVVELDWPTFMEGFTCANMGFTLAKWIKPRKLGGILSNHTGIITHRDPDTLRTMDLAFYTFARMPMDDITDTYPEVAPELLVQVKSFGNGWPEIEVKVAEFLDLGALVVCVLDPKTRAAHLYDPDQPARTLGPDDELTFPECLPGFQVFVRSLFE